MKRSRRNVAREIIEDLKGMHATLNAGTPLSEKYRVRTIRVVPDPAEYRAADIRRTRELVGVSQAIFAQLLGVSAALVQAWESGQRTPAPITRRLLDLVRADPSNWRKLVEAA